MISDLLPTAILIPSLNRPQNVRRTIENLAANTPEAHYTLWCVSDPESKKILDEAGEWYLDDSDRDDRRYVTRMNRLLSYIEDARTIFFDSDDVIHHPRWLTYALAVMDETGKSCVVVNDQRNMAGTQAVIRREYLERAVFDKPGLAFHPGYIHNYADNEMFYTAQVQDEFARAPLAVVEHLHPAFKAANALPWDKTYLDAYRGIEHDLAIWRERHDLIEQIGPAEVKHW